MARRSGSSFPHSQSSEWSWPVSLARNIAAWAIAWADEAGPPGSGAAGIFYAISGYASAGMMTAEEYDRWLYPLDERILRALPKAAWFNVLHLCRGRLHFDIARRLPVQAISWSVADPGNPSLAEGRRLSGKAVMGGLGHRTTLYRGTPEEVVSEAREALRETAGERFLLAPGCSVPPGARTENLVAMMKAVAA